MSEQRRKTILSQLSQSQSPLSASFFAELMGVTRQVIVGDIALLRASGAKIIATPRGYLLESKPENNYILPCIHDEAGLAEELYTIVDSGCGLIDVIVEHSLYGQITCNLHIFSRKDVDNFIEKMKETKARPLSYITNDIHLHTVQCPSEEHFFQLKRLLQEKGFYVEHP